MNLYRGKIRFLKKFKKIKTIVAVVKRNGRFYIYFNNIAKVSYIEEKYAIALAKDFCDAFQMQEKEKRLSFIERLLRWLKDENLEFNPERPSF